MLGSILDINVGWEYICFPAHYPLRVTTHKISNHIIITDSIVDWPVLTVNTVQGPHAKNAILNFMHSNSLRIDQTFNNV